MPKIIKMRILLGRQHGQNKGYLPATESLFCLYCLFLLNTGNIVPQTAGAKRSDRRDGLAGNATSMLHKARGMRFIFGWSQGKMILTGGCEIDI